MFFFFSFKDWVPPSYATQWFGPLYQPTPPARYQCLWSSTQLNKTLLGFSPDCNLFSPLPHSLTVCQSSHIFKQAGTTLKLSLNYAIGLTVVISITFGNTLGHIQELLLRISSVYFPPQHSN